MNETEAARFVRAALDVILASIPDSTEAWSETEGLRVALINDIRAREAIDPPWDPERPVHETWPERPAVWGTVVPGDYVLAPDSRWYEIDSWSRIGEKVGVMIKVGPTLVKDSFSARTPVTIRRGPEGMAVDVLAAAGITSEVI